jgi:hypothetical protein
LLIAGHGGAIVVVCDTKSAHSLQIDYLDGGKALGAFLKYGKNLHQNRREFETLMNAFSVHTDSDRWEPWVTKGLAEELGQNQDVFKELIDEAKDGAIVLSLNGTVLAVAARLRHLNKYRLITKKGRGAGTRHSAAMGVVEWMSNEGVTGVVFVRSDSGAITTLVPSSPQQPPKLFTLKRRALKDIEEESEDENGARVHGDRSEIDGYRPIFLQFFGLMPSPLSQRSQRLQHFALLFACSIAVAINISNMLGVFCDNYNVKETWDRHFVTDATFSAVMLLSVFLFPSPAKIVKIVEIAEAWAIRSGFGQVWGNSIRKKTKRVLALWLFALASRCTLWFAGKPVLRFALGLGNEGTAIPPQQKKHEFECGIDMGLDVVRSALDIFAYVITSSVFSAMALLLLYVLGALRFSRNHFVNSVIEMSDYDKTIRDWNLIQAFFYKLSSAVEFIFVCFIGSVVIAALNFAREWAVQRIYFVTSTHIFIPLCAQIFLMIYVFLSAQNFTDSCARTPSVINSLIPKTARVMDPKRHFLVEYVAYSDTGFRVFGRLITSQASVILAIGACLAILIMFSLNMWYSVSDIMEVVKKAPTP